MENRPDHVSVERGGVGNMARIRKVEIANFRSIQSLEWRPSAGLNCLIGPGDSGKSTILDAIDLCLGARRTIQFTDADFHNLDVESPISISLTLGELADGLKNIDTYGLYLRGFDADSGEVEDEPERDLETVLTLNLSVGDDLEPVWSLVSDRAKAQDTSRNLTWGDRVQLAPTRIGASADHNLGWRRGSVLNRLSDEKADAAAALAKAAREAREAFGDQAEGQLEETLAIVSEAAKELGVDVGDNVRALLDAHSVTFTGGTISLHNEQGIPLRGLGTGSARLLVAGLQRRSAKESSLLLVDELEHGLEPHRIIRLIGSLGGKEVPPPLQVFMTTHSPIVLRELSGAQLWIVRERDAEHDVLNVGSENDVQSAIRLYPDAFLASSVIVSEGASEVGLVRGLDQHRYSNGSTSIMALGVSLIDCGGGGANRPYERAAALHRLGYVVAVLRDDDQKPNAATEKAFTDAGGTVLTWRDGRTIEDELFASLPDQSVIELVDYAIELHGDELIDAHIKQASNNAQTLGDVRNEALLDGLSKETRAKLGAASQFKKAGWFKSVSWMEHVGRTIVGPVLAESDPSFQDRIEAIFSWSADV